MRHPDAEALIAEVRSSGFDLRRTAFLTFVVAVGDEREAAFAMLRWDEQPEWFTSLYGDGSGWLVRVSHSCRLTPDVLDACFTTVADLAASCGGSIRGLMVEDLRADDCWAVMAGKLREPKPATEETASAKPAQSTA
jgi:predicted MFS family arabinose efflux permease